MLHSTRSHPPPSTGRSSRLSTEHISGATLAEASLALTAGLQWPMVSLLPPMPLQAVLSVPGCCPCTHSPTQGLDDNTKHTDLPGNESRPLKHDVAPEEG